jgi:hypothetical protein
VAGTSFSTFNAPEPACHGSDDGGDDNSSPFVDLLQELPISVGDSESGWIPNPTGFRIRKYFSGPTSMASGGIRKGHPHPFLAYTTSYVASE